MKTVSRILAALLALSLLFAAGCSEQKPTTPSDEPSSTPSGTVDPADASTDLAEIQATALGLKADDVAANINGKPVTVREFLYWANATYSSWGFTDIDWDMDLDGMTVEEVLKDNVINSVKLYHVVEAKCDELNVTLSEADEEELASAKDNLIAQYGSEEAYRQALSESLLTEDLYNYMLRVSYLYSYLFEEVYGIGGSKCSDEEAVSFGNDNGYLRAKHILLSKMDDDGDLLSDEEYQKRYEKLEELIAILDASDDPVAKFDELMHEYTEDPGVASYPDGYQWTEGAMVPSFEEATKALDDYGYSGVVEMAEYGYTIVMRLPLDPDAYAINDKYGYSLRMNAAMANFDTILSVWTDELSVEFLPAYSKLDYKTALTADLAVK